MIKAIVTIANKKNEITIHSVEKYEDYLLIMYSSRYVHNNGLTLYVTHLMPATVTIDNVSYKIDNKKTMNQLYHNLSTSLALENL